MSFKLFKNGNEVEVYHTDLEWDIVTGKQIGRAHV